MKSFYFILSFSFITFFSFGQSPPTIKTKNLVSDKTFSKISFEDLNFLVVGDNTPQQGLVFELKDNNSIIKASGLLKNDSKFIATVDGEFSVDSGVYFFDEGNGSKNSKFTINFYKLFRPSRKFNGLRTSTGDYKAKAERVYIQNYLAKRKLLRETFSKYKKLKEKLQSLNIDVTDAIDTNTKKTTLENRYLVKFDIDPAYTLKEMDITNNDVIKKLDIDLGKQKPIDQKDFSADQKIDIEKLISEFESTQKFLKDSIELKLQGIEKRVTKDLWTSKSLWFASFSPFYQRENFTIYQPNSSIQDFSKQFDEIFGDVYGATLSLNYYTKSNITWWKNLYAKGAISISRNSNRSSFRNRNIRFTEATGDSINGNPITLLSTRDAYVGDKKYQYGTSSDFSFEAYWLPKYGNWPVGLFGNVGYSYTNFPSGEDIEDIEVGRMRLGLLVNLKAKDKTKNILTFQAFLDRSNLSLDPKGEDKDLRFGFKIGLPINIKSSL
ncbi:hypothetical protein D1815_06340 [Aquimarina sp. AD1]|uniref:hypothetical protein n=1 Tax=Aquimarina sp. (strain AD1) TaxID=1714848 RepID=UPI000E46A915|nr:hypothetical protein [Aquimarina sp. AD1]AXT55393.1 hypothetical protein D1815_06340 [Aquimarina sp. AD1]RKN23226.1 hypothetical protein D7035_11485 [Aquimarina sp. AD1]